MLEKRATRNRTCTSTRGSLCKSIPKESYIFTTREEYQTQEGEALRDDENYTFASTWEFKGIDKPPILHKEDLNFETVTPTQRSYK